MPSKSMKWTEIIHQLDFFEIYIGVGVKPGSLFSIHIFSLNEGKSRQDSAIASHWNIYYVTKLNYFQVYY